MTLKDNNHTEYMLYFGSRTCVTSSVTFSERIYS